MSKHTPGPFTCCPRHRSGAPAKAMCGPSTWHSPEEQETRRRLLAAAPDMLEALRRVAHIPCEMKGNAHCTMIRKPGDFCPFCAIRAAIAKAEGG